jgi:thiamine pyrophosphate-dependent acetolactate synthase large subunit-like protein
MNLGSLTTIGTIKPKNFIHIIFDNHAHESTGGQPTNTKNISISNIGKVTNFHVFEINDINNLRRQIKKIKKINGTIMIVVKINNSKIRSGRVTLDPVLIKNRFMESL